MKNILFLTVLLLTTSCTKKHDGFLTLEIKNGAGVLKEVNFEISESTIEEIEKSIPHVKKMIEQEYCPSRILMKLCKQCSYYDFCWSGE